MTTLTPEQQKAIQQWNSLGMGIHENTMRAFIPTWFSNVRSLIKANFPLHGVKELTDRLGQDYDTFVVLGSGPSAQEICHRLPLKHAVLCSPTALGALAREFVRPAAIVVADHNPVLYKHVAETKFFRPDTLDVVLPVTADPSWYAPDSVLSRDRLYFYLNYMDYLGDIDLAYNNILKALLPDVPHHIIMGGSVALTAWAVADAACGESTSKRVYLGFDFSWPKGGPYRAPLRFENIGVYSDLVRQSWLDQQKPLHPTIESGAVESDLMAIGFAIQLMNAVHFRMINFPFAKDRYALIDVASKLFSSASPKVRFPNIHSEDTDKILSCDSDENWAYSLLLGLVDLSNKLHSRLRQELVEKILHDWHEKPEVQNVVDVPREDFLYVRKAVHDIEPSVKFKYNGEEIPEEDNSNGPLYP